MKPARTVRLVVGAVIALVGLGLLVGGATLGWALASQRDNAGYFTTENERFGTDTFALTSDEIDLGGTGGRAMGDGSGMGGGMGNWANATIRVRVDSATDRAVFVGIARVSDIDEYLAGVPHDRVDSAGHGGMCWLPGCTSSRMFGADYRRENAEGTSSPVPPATQTFWVAQASGTGSQDLTWKVQNGRWAIAVMHADGTPQVLADVQVGGRVDYLVPIAIGLLIAAMVMLAGGAALIVVGLDGRHTTDVQSWPRPVSAPFAPPPPRNVSVPDPPATAAHPRQGDPA